MRDDAQSYEFYCLADRTFYDTPTNRGADHPDFEPATRPVPAGWQHAPGETWMHYAPEGLQLPQQGWKIHVSARLADVERTLETVWAYCVPRGIAFKFLRNEAVLVMANSKAAPRGSSGKLVTIYPADEAQLELVLKELDDLLDDVRGPYILSDLRYGEGALFVRYGAFVSRFCLSPTGERVLALEDDHGQLVPDHRGPTFSMPPWVALPTFLQPHLDARNAVTTNDLAYSIESVIQFSNGGGVYLGHHNETGDRVVLKEGRPHAGLDISGRDAVARIAHEHEILERLQGLDVVPKTYEHLELGEHHFLVQEHIDSVSLQRELVSRYPLSRPDATEADRAAFAEWATQAVEQVTKAVGQLHDRGVVFCDLHPDNVLLDADGRMVLIDFEVATLAKDKARSTLAHPGYAAPADRQGVEVDRYALACITLGVYAPQTTILLNFHPGKAFQLADMITETFPVPRATIDAAVRTVVGPEVTSDPELAELALPGKAEWADVRAALTKAITASATPERTDRLFPGDIAQFRSGGGINLATGAAGVLYALAKTDAGRFPEYEEWLRKQSLDTEAGPGLYDGLHGVAHVLDELGHRQDALDLVDRTLADDWSTRELGLHSGLSGIGLSLLHFDTEPALRAQAVRVLDLVAERLGDIDDVPELSGGQFPRAGLMYGSSGPALLFLEAFERLGDTGLLDLAEIAIRQDLRRCTPTPEGMIQVNQGWRTLPYLEEGSAGIALALQRYLRHRPNDELAAILAQLERVAHCSFYVQPGLFMGRAGLLLTAAALGAEQATVDDLVYGLGWHAMPYAGGLAFPGQQLLRLSMDLSTGSAGVLLALGSALHTAPASLPFLGPPQWSESSSRLFAPKEV
ncbi:protein kinase/lanthionine synthetase C family protein [Kribbella sandramycini]|uniref:non-specific serine/threonine protein kinase n=1 Tax=Kribbella sandramycini TaxID=60450 RepID=A0A7Y4NZU1_9ACTN|nr:class III lanthionine synthetase LanKC [Kribbella sandramycini]MBB6564996.1 serine/threonine protein kinase [Kribbella sandramycini]NOL41268.1 protein kinase/lanthionine synthetase C family protein [Kribbella sandramycini]